MRIRPAVAALALSGALLAAAPASAQVIMSLNNIATGGLPHEDCMRRGHATLQISGLIYHDTTSEAVWGRTSDGRYMVSIYCLRTRDVAVIAAAGAAGAVTSSLVNRLVNAWHQTQ